MASFDPIIGDSEFVGGASMAVSVTCDLIVLNGSLVTLQVCDMIVLEKSELEMIRDQCSNDMASIGERISNIVPEVYIDSMEMHIIYLYMCT